MMFTPQDPRELSDKEMTEKPKVADEDRGKA